MIDEKIFKSYDVRGIYPTEINEEAAYKIGQAFATYIQDEVVVGRDMRLSSPILFDNFAKGANSVGSDVIDLEMCTTPMLNFAVAHKKFKGGVMITASHNPPEYNGIKLIGEQAVQFDKEHGIGAIAEIVFENKAIESEKKGIIKKYDILPEYKSWLKEKIDQIKPLKIVVDYGNGVGAISAKEILKDAGLEIISLYSEPDGTYPNHLANPAEEKNLVDIKKAILENKCDLGVAFDGDGDRAFFIDETGQTVDPGFLLAALSSNELKSHSGEKVYYDLRFSKGVVKAIENAGGIPVRTKVGNPFYKQKLILEGGLMAAEYSGHFMYKQNYGLDDGLFSTFKVIYWLGETNKKMSEFVGEFHKGHYLTGEINLEVHNSVDMIQKLEQKYSGGKIDKLDGATIDFDDWWFNLRASNTEPVVRLNIEADNAELLSEKKEELVNFIKNN